VSDLASGSYNFVTTYGGDANNKVVTSACGAAHETATVTCTRTIGGTVTGVASLSGSTCVVNATFTGALVVPKGAALDIESSSIRGAIVADGASAIRICASSVVSVTILNSTGPVVIGDAADGCAPNTVAGAITITGNTHGVQVIGNTVAGAVVASGNSGSGPFPDDTAPNISGNVR